MRVPSARSPGVGLAKVPQRAYLDLAGATAWDISPVGSRGNLDLMQYALISFDVQLILAQMPPAPAHPWHGLRAAMAPCYAGAGLRGDRSGLEPARGLAVSGAAVATGSGGGSRRRATARPASRGAPGVRGPRGDHDDSLV